MNKINQLRVSIVIPVYNEADRITACLSAIAQQTLKPFEVIVVDNNSNDATVLLAQRFDFVKVLQESRQGVTNARNTGFNAASGDIIGRIDADTLVPTDWVTQIAVIMADKTIDAVSGPVSYYDAPFESVTGWFDQLFRRQIAHGMGKEVFLYGANMAVRRSAWLDVRSVTCLQSGLHEDFDLAIHMAALDLQVVMRTQLIAAVSMRRVNAKFIDFWHYIWLSPQTYAQHQRTRQYHMYPACALAILFFIPLKLLHQGYDASSAYHFSLKTLWQGSFIARVNPATYID